jgi:hypothetical protein
VTLEIWMDDDDALWLTNYNQQKTEGIKIGGGGGGRKILYSGHIININK